MKMEITVDTSDGEPTPDHDTLLLIHSDTSDASTTFVDSSPSGRTITVVNNTQHDTAQKKFGASSILFDGTNDELTIPDSADWVFAGNFTIDFWIRTGTAGDLMTHATSATAGNTNFDFRLGGGGSQFGALVSNGSSFPVNIVGGANLADSAWHHLALVRLGNRFDIYVAGTSVANATSAVSINDVSAPITIGKAFNGANDFNGHMDEIRISKVARWDANFTPPSAPYP